MAGDSEPQKKDAYAQAGVDYDDVDPAKVLFMKEALGTLAHAKNLGRFGYEDVAWSRGESVHLVKGHGHYLGFVVEGLGTKNLVVDGLGRALALADKAAVASALGQAGLRTAGHWRAIGQDVVAMIVNDMATLGVAPLVVGMHLAAGSGGWFADEERCIEYARGVAKGCTLARAAWGCGETPILKGIIAPDTVELSGAAYGIADKKRVIRCDVAAGDAIVLLSSSGIHANGLTLAREIAEKTRGGYLARLEDGSCFGEALLAPTVIYTDLVQDLLEAGVDIHYGINVTGHGWRKLMRLRKPFTYVVDRIPTPQPVFRFIQRHGKVPERDMYANYNMGAGYALILPEKDVKRVRRLAPSHGIEVVGHGHVDKPFKDKRRRVIISPLTFDPFVGAELAIR